MDTNSENLSPPPRKRFNESLYLKILFILYNWYHNIPNIVILGPTMLQWFLILPIWKVFYDFKAQTTFLLLFSCLGRLCHPLILIIYTDTLVLLIYSPLAELNFMADVWFYVDRFKTYLMRWFTSTTCRLKLTAYKETYLTIFYIAFLYTACLYFVVWCIIMHTVE